MHDSKGWSAHVDLACFTSNRRSNPVMRTCERKTFWLFFSCLQLFKWAKTWHKSNLPYGPPWLKRNQWEFHGTVASVSSSPLPSVLTEGILLMWRSRGCGQDGRNESVQTLGVGGWGGFSLSLILCFLRNINRWHDRDGFRCLSVEGLGDRW